MRHFPPPQFPTAGRVVAFQLDQWMVMPRISASERSLMGRGAILVRDYLRIPAQDQWHRLERDRYQRRQIGLRIT